MEELTLSVKNVCSPLNPLESVDEEEEYHDNERQHLLQNSRREKDRASH